MRYQNPGSMRIRGETSFAQVTHLKDRVTPHAHPGVALWGERTPMGSRYVTLLLADYAHFGFQVCILHCTFHRCRIENAVPAFHFLPHFATAQLINCLLGIQSELRDEFVGHEIRGFGARGIDEHMVVQAEGCTGLRFSQQVLAALLPRYPHKVGLVFWGHGIKR